MEEQFVPPEQASELDALGFKFENLGYYYNQVPSSGKWVLENYIWDLATDYMDAPIWDQAFDWFRNKGYYISIVMDPAISKNGLYVFELFHLDQFIFETQDYKPYKEARLEALKELINYERSHCEKLYPL